MQEAHSHQLRHTFHYGAALRFDGFALLFNILCERRESRVRGSGKSGREEEMKEGREKGKEKGKDSLILRPHFSACLPKTSLEGRRKEGRER